MPLPRHMLELIWCSTPSWDEKPYRAPQAAEPIDEPPMGLPDLASERAWCAEQKLADTLRPKSPRVAATNAIQEAVKHHLRANPDSSMKHLRDLICAAGLRVGLDSVTAAVIVLERRGEVVRTTLHDKDEVERVGGRWVWSIASIQ